MKRPFRKNGTEVCHPTSVPASNSKLVAGVGFEPTTFGQLSDETGDYFCGISVRQ